MPCSRHVAQVSADGEEVESTMVSLEFDNRGGSCAWKLLWVTPEGERVQYGVLRRNATLLQQTFPGHVWELVETERPAASPLRPALQYAAAAHDGLVVVAEDAAGEDLVNLNGKARAASAAAAAAA